jgi:poly(A) polymerase
MWIQTKKIFPLPEFVKETLSKLRERKFTAFVVGGSVRDFLLDRPSKDHDIATDATPDQVLEIFPSGLTVGKVFGVIKFAEFPLEIATFRKDKEYKDHRHPVGVEFSTPEEDAKRRDFTINALFYDPKTQRILDTVDGIKDLEAKILRTVGEPSRRFQEDALRLLRALRFSGSLGFAIEPKTQQAILDRAALIKRVSGERVLEELNLILTSAKAAEGVQQLKDFNLLNHLVPELTELDQIDGGIQKTIRMLQKAVKDFPERSHALSWAVLLHDIGKTVAFRRNDGRNFNGHETDGTHLAKQVAHRFKMSNADTDLICSIISDHLKFKDVFQMREATLQRWVRKSYFPELLKFHKCDTLVGDGNLAYYEFCLSRLNELQLRGDPPKLISGDDLIHLGFGPGPLFSKILTTIEDLTLEGRFNSKEQALEYVVKYFVK